MKKNILIVLGLVILAILIFGAKITLAQDVELPNPLGLKTIIELLDRIMAFIFIMSIPVATIMLMYAGFQYITSAGNPKNIPAISKMIQYTLIGFFIVLAARGIISVVQSVLLDGSTSTGTTTASTVSGGTTGSWVCTADGKCISDPSGGGGFNSLDECVKFPCQKIDTYYQCNPATKLCEPNFMAIGTTDEASCNAACKK